MAIEMFKRGAVEMLALLILNEDLFTQFCISCLTRAILFLRKIFLRLSLGVSVFALSIPLHLKDENIWFSLRKNTISYMTAFAAFLKGAKVFNYEYRYRRRYT